MRKLSGLFSIAAVFLLVAVTSARDERQADPRPATIGGESDSVAAELHYPPKERIAGKQAAISFYCEVLPNGKAAHITILEQRGNWAFQDAVEKALRRGRFAPATANGRPAAVMVGGTALFTMKSGRPTITVRLNTADRSKIFAPDNYIQPQMIGGHTDFVRKLLEVGQKIDFDAAVRPTAEVLVHVDGQGNVTGTKLLRENPPKGGFGPVLAKALQTAKFIPAFDNGKTVPGNFNLPFSFPDAGLRTGTHIKRP
jgi:TonB family protein